MATVAGPGRRRRDRAGSRRTSPRPDRPGLRPPPPGQGPHGRRQPPASPRSPAEGPDLFCRSVTGSIRPTQRLALTLSLIILDEPTRSLARGWHALQLYQAVGDSTRQAAALNYMGTWPTPCSGDTSAAWPPASRHSNLLTTPMTRTSGSCSLRPWTASASVAEVPAGVRRPAASGRSLYFRMKIWRQLVRAVRPTRDLDGQDVGAQDAARGVGV